MLPSFWNGQDHHRVMICIHIVLVTEATCQVSLKSGQRFQRRKPGLFMYTLEPHPIE